MKLYPVFANLEKRLAVIIGGGEIAHRKLKDLLDASANIKIIAPEIHNAIKLLQEKQPETIELIQRKYKNGDLAGAYIVFAATGDAGVNKAIYLESEERKILMNSADDPDNCSFFVPSMTRKGDLLIAVSTSGNSPAMAARVRKMLEERIPENIEEVLSALRKARELLKDIENLNQSQRGEILKKIVNDDSLLSDIIRHNENNTLSSFFNCILNSIK